MEKRHPDAYGMSSQTSCIVRPRKAYLVSLRKAYLVSLQKVAQLPQSQVFAGSRPVPILLRLTLFASPHAYSSSSSGIGGAPGAHAPSSDEDPSAPYDSGFTQPQYSELSRRPSATIANNAALVEKRQWLSDRRRPFDHFKTRNLALVMAPKAMVMAAGPAFMTVAREEKKRAMNPYLDEYEPDWVELFADYPTRLARVRFHSDISHDTFEVHLDSSSTPQVDISTTYSEVCLILILQFI